MARGHLCLYIVARWQYIFVSKLSPPRPVLPSSQQPGDRLRFPARSHSLLDLHQLTLTSEGCLNCAKVFAASSHPRIGWIEHEGGVEVPISSMAHNWSGQSVPF